MADLDRNNLNLKPKSKIFGIQPNAMACPTTTHMPAETGNSARISCSIAFNFFKTDMLALSKNLMD
jgi:hypothetical protein